MSKSRPAVGRIGRSENLRIYSKDYKVSEPVDQLLNTVYGIIDGTVEQMTGKKIPDHILARVKATKAREMAEYATDLVRRANEAAANARKGTFEVHNTHGRAECKHGTLVWQCRCLLNKENPTIVGCPLSCPQYEEFVEEDVDVTPDAWTPAQLESMLYSVCLYLHANNIVLPPKVQPWFDEYEVQTAF